MKTSDFAFNLPEKLIAQFPLESRTDSRLLILNESAIQDAHFRDIIGLLEAGDLLVFNNTKVIPARLFGQKESGGKIELLIERILDDQQALAHIKASKSPKPGSRLLFEHGLVATVTERQGTLFKLRFSEAVLPALERQGHMPLPPYITREDELTDKDRYQTVYAQKPGAVAAPTAGLHFDQALLEKIKDKGIDTAEVTLHVGAGTFQPVRVDNILEHHMHSEYVEVPEITVSAVNACKQRGGRVIAVGTTSVRSLESASQSGQLLPYYGDTNIFIYPGYQFKTVDALITNFHLPESTLLMLVCALAGYDVMMQAYRHAVEQQYRFFSYGDAMFINPAAQSNQDKLP